MSPYDGTVFEDWSYECFIKCNKNVNVKEVASASFDEAPDAESFVCYVKNVTVEAKAAIQRHSQIVYNFAADKCVCIDFIIKIDYIALSCESYNCAFGDI